MNTMSQPSKLKPEVVPWTIAASASNLQLSLTENAGGELLVDTFWGNHSPEPLYRRVRLRFSNVAASYYAMCRSDSERGGREEFDWSAVFTQPTTEEELQNWLETNAENWASSGNCPDPKLYAVEDSAWAKEYFGIPKHFLLCGGDCFVEILAEGYDWMVDEASDGDD